MRTITRIQIPRSLDMWVCKECEDTLDVDMPFVTEPYRGILLTCQNCDRQIEVEMFLKETQV